MYHGINETTEELTKLENELHNNISTTDFDVKMKKLKEDLYNLERNIRDQKGRKYDCDVKDYQNAKVLKIGLAQREFPGQIIMILDLNWNPREEIPLPYH